MTELMVRNEAVLFNFNSIQESVQKLQKKEFDAVIQSLHYDTQRLTQMEAKVRQLEQLQLKLKTVDDSCTQLIKQVNEGRDAQLFCERILPLMVHLQCVEACRQLVVSEGQRQNLASFDLDRVKQLNRYIKAADGYPVRLPALKERLVQYGRYIENNSQGTAPFIFGADYQITLNVEKQPPFNKKNQWIEIDTKLTQNIKLFKQYLE